jgi:hypothetical protein
VRGAAQVGAEEVVLVVELQPDGPQLREIADQIRPLDGSTKDSDLLAQHDHEVQRQEAGKDVPLDVVLHPVVIDGPRLQQALEIAARVGPSPSARSEHRDHQDRLIVINKIGIVITGIGGS